MMRHMHLNVRGKRTLRLPAIRAGHTTITAIPILDVLTHLAADPTPASHPLLGTTQAA